MPVDGGHSWAMRLLPFTAAVWPDLTLERQVTPFWVIRRLRRQRARSRNCQATKASSRQVAVTARGDTQSSSHVTDA